MFNVFLQIVNYELQIAHIFNLFGLPIMYIEKGGGGGG